MLEEIRELYEYNTWANRRFLDTIAGLDADEYARNLRSSFPSVQATMTHVLAGEWVWLQRWRGVSPTGFPQDWDTSTPEQLRRLWQTFESDQQQFLSGVAEADLPRSIEYRTIAGQSYSSPLRQMLRHVVNHSTYHRGQVATMLRQLGSPVPVSDLIAFYRERTAIGPGATQP